MYILALQVTVVIFFAENFARDAESVMYKLLEELSKPPTSGTVYSPTDLIQRIYLYRKQLEGIATNFTLHSEDSTGRFLSESEPSF